MCSTPVFPNLAFNCAPTPGGYGLASDVVARVGGKPARLFEVLLHPAVRVFEPLWTVVMSSKALLPAPPPLAVVRAT